MWPFSSETSDTEGLQFRLRISPATQEAAVGFKDDGTPTLFGIEKQRLGIHPIVRGPLLAFGAFFTGFSLGAAQGTLISGYRYRAENAHRLPNTKSGWFLYQKSKNYNAMLGGIKEGVRYGSGLTAWALLFVVAEEGIDQARARLFARQYEDLRPGQRDFANTVLAAMGLSGFYSWWKGFDRFAAARTSKMALKGSLAFGLLQDTLASLRGDRPAYVDWLLNKTRSAMP